MRLHIWTVGAWGGLHRLPPSLGVGIIEQGYGLSMPDMGKVMPLRIYMPRLRWRGGGLKHRRFVLVRWTAARRIPMGEPSC